MSIHIILGKPGSGKSLYATSRVIAELRDTKRNIVTNLPLHPGRLNEYLQQKYPHENLNMVARLRVLSDDELREFWKFRGPSLCNEYLAREDPAYTIDANGTDDGRGVAYFLDEAHIAFNARDWATLGRGAIHYMSQHRKLGDIVWPITQSPGNLDKQFRSVAEDFTVLRNEYTAKFGIFRGRGRFVRRTYLAEPQPNAEPFETAAFTLDREGVASCYDTARGIGVHGNKADIGRRASGIPIWTVIPAALALALACVLLPYFLGRGVGRLSGAGAKKAPEKAVTAPGLPLPANYLEVKTTASPALAAPAAAPQQPPVLWVTGITHDRFRVLVTLSDGRTLTSEDGTMKFVGRNYVDLVDGTRLWLRRSTQKNS